MNDLDFARRLRRYLERRGEMNGGILFRMPPRGEGMTSPRTSSVGRAEGSTVAASAEGVQAPIRAASHDRVEKPFPAESSKQPPPMRREYIVKAPVKRKPEATQADMFGETRSVPAVSDLSGLDLEALEERVSSCTLCPLCEGRNRTVFGSGDPKAKIVFIGEAPGREEDLRGEPFVGRAGQLLTKILASVGFTREEVYITNILKCRPPENRDPNEKEVRACKPYLKRQIELLDPALICALGRVAGQNLLERNASLSVLRQHIHYYEDVRAIVTYHPAALLRNPNLKRAAWEDIQETRRIYDEALKDM